MNDFKKTVSVSEKMCCIFVSKTSQNPCCFGDVLYFILNSSVVVFIILDMIPRFITKFLLSDLGTF